MGRRSRRTYALPAGRITGSKNVVYEYATKPFAIGYRISPEESATGGLRIEDTYKLLDRLISSGISYIHTSLVSINDSYPVESPNGPELLN